MPALALTFRRTDGEGRCPVSVAMQRGSTSDVWPKGRACNKSNFGHLFLLCRYINTVFHNSFLFLAGMTPLLSPVPTHRFCTHFAAPPSVALACPSSALWAFVELVEPRRLKAARPASEHGMRIWVAHAAQGMVLFQSKARL